MFKFSLKESVKISLIVIISMTALFAQTTKKTKGVGNKSNTSEQTSTTETSNNTKSKKRVIVVLNFDDASLTAENQKREMGRQMAVLLSNEFARRGDFEVVERASIDKVIKEQDGTYDSRNDPKLAAQIGKNWSASSVVVGTVTEYTITTKRTAVLGIGKITTTAKVGLAVRLVNVNTGEIQDSVNVNGVDNKSDNINPYTTSSTDVNEDLKTSLLTAAANKAIVEAVNKLEKLIDKNTGVVTNPNQNSTVSTNTTTEEKKNNSVLGKINPFKKNPKKEETPSQSAPQNSPVATSTPSVTAATPGKVIAVIPNKIVLKGTFASAKVGTQLIVYRIIKEHLDPDNPKIVVFTETEDVAKIEILEIQPGGISAKILSGAGIKVGDLVKLP